jgi:hypothetical protein
VSEEWFEPSSVLEEIRSLEDGRVIGSVEVDVLTLKAWADHLEGVEMELELTLLGLDFAE